LGTAQGIGCKRNQALKARQPHNLETKRCGWRWRAFSAHDFPLTTLQPVGLGWLLAGPLALQSSSHPRHPIRITPIRTNYTHAYQSLQNLPVT
jgi:hypothetical protein